MTEGKESIYKMRNGDLMKEKGEYISERFRTKEGLADFFIGTAIWAYIVVNYKDPIFNYLLNHFSGYANVGAQPPFTLQYYLAYLAFGIIFTGIGWVVSYVIVNVFRKVNGK